MFFSKMVWHVWLKGCKPWLTCCSHVLKQHGEDKPLEKNKQRTHPRAQAPPKQKLLCLFTNRWLQMLGGSCHFQVLWLYEPLKQVVLEWSWILRDPKESFTPFLDSLLPPYHWRYNVPYELVNIASVRAACWFKKEINSKPIQCNFPTKWISWQSNSELFLSGKWMFPYPSEIFVHPKPIPFVSSFRSQATWRKFLPAWGWCKHASFTVNRNQLLRPIYRKGW